ncbi:MAG: hypothetical protein MHMPM18_000424 [Marteilia pararefringens]
MKVSQLSSAADNNDMIGGEEFMRDSESVSTPPESIKFQKNCKRLIEGGSRVGKVGAFGKDQPMRRNISLETRQSIIDHFTQHKLKKSEISKLVNMPRSTVVTIINRYVKTGRLKILKRGGDRRSLLKGDNIKIIVSWMTENKGMTLKMLKEKIGSVMGIVVSQSTITRTLKKYNVDRKW